MSWKKENKLVVVLLLVLVILVPTASWIGYQYAVYAGGAISGITYGPGDLEAPSWIIFKDGSTYYAKNGTTRAIDYSGTNATTVIQTVINTYDSLYQPVWIYAKGHIDIEGQLIFDNKQNVRFTFDFLNMLTNSAQIIVRNKPLPIPTIIEGMYILNQYNGFAKEAILIQDAVGVEINVGLIQNTVTSPPWTGSGLKLFSSTATGVAQVNAEIGVISGFSKGILLNITGGSSFISVNKIHVDSISSVAYAVKIESNTSGSPQIFHNSFEVHVALDDLSGSPITYGIYTTGKTTGNTFWDYENWDIPVANTVSYYADNKTFGTRFIGGMPRNEVIAYWQDSGNATEFLSVYAPDTNIYTRLATANSPLLSQTGAVDNVAKIKSSITCAFEMGVYINVTAIAGATLRVNAEYYDKNNVLHAVDVFGAITTTGVRYNQTIVLAKGETFLKFWTTVAGGTITYDISAWVIAR